jgi:hypothetical protein
MAHSEIMQSFYEHTVELIDSIDDCAAKGRVLPCLTLLYTGMDIMASLDSEQGQHNRTSFVRWVDSYLLKHYPIGCTALDLYAARCGIAHAYTADSSLYREGKAKKIAYATGDGTVGDLERTIASLGHSDWRSVHISDLIKAFRNAVANHLDHIENDDSAKKRFINATGLWFSNIPGTDVKDYLAEIDSKPE